MDNGVLTIQPARVEINDGFFALSGEFSTTQLAGRFQLDDFNLAPIAQFAALPVDLQGRLTLDGKLAGSLQQPQVDGTVGVVNTSINGETFKPIQGTFRYADAYLNFATTQPSYLQVKANVPLPFGAAPESDTFTVNANVGSPAFRLLGVLTQDQVVWSSGEADLQLNAEGRLNIPDQIFGLNTASGQLRVQDATIEATALKNPLRLDGQIDFENDRFRVDRFEGGFAKDSKFLITGVLPLLLPLTESDPDADQPLTVAIDRQALDIQEIYRGEVEGNVIVTGSLLVPVVSGEFQVANGEVFIPRQVPSASNTDGEAFSFQDMQFISPRVKDFKLVLGPKLSARLRAFTDVRLAADLILPTLRPLAKVQVAGDVTVNGPIADLQPDGTITVESAWLDILNTTFRLDQNSPNTVTFVPEQGLLNPNVDITVSANASESNELRRENAERGREVREDIVPNARPQEIDVFIDIKGPLAFLVPTETIRTCLPQNTQPVAVATSAYTPDELETVAECLNLSVREGLADGDASILGSPIIDLRSIPERGRGQIVALLGNQFTDAIQEDLDQANEFNLATFATTQYVIRPLTRNIDATIRRWGKGIGLINLRLIPTVRATRQVGPNAFIDVDYDYGYALSPGSADEDEGAGLGGVAKATYRISF